MESMSEVLSQGQCRQASEEEEEEEQERCWYKAY